MKIYIVSLVIYVFSFEAFACSCRLGSVEEKFKSHEEIFVGTVDSIKYLDAKNAFGDQRIIVSFKVERNWKGKGSSKILHTANNGMGCYGYWFKEGEDYLVYSFEEDEGRLNTMWCGGVIPKESEKNEFENEVIVLNELAN
ncbi:MAG: hypothetical protein HWE27_14210 [Gammaproteobacteria bacterium]|nr:hypothetical protein [Gammaproteobacteria bacterium]